MKHPGGYNAGPAGSPPPTYATDKAYVEDSQQYSVMSYFGETNTGADFKGANARTPLLHDIAAAQMFYGANMSSHTGDNVYGFNSNSGPQYAISSATEKAVFSIWDAGGNDTLDLSGYSDKQTINLNSNSFSDAGGLKKNISMADAVDVNGNNSWEKGFDPNHIANLVENAKGGSGDDTIFGNQADNRLEGGAGKDALWGGDGRDTLLGGMGDDLLNGGAQNDILDGGSGNDTLDGGTGADIMSGGIGNDTYIVDNAGDQVFEDLSALGGNADKILTSLNTYDLSVNGKGVGVENLEYTGTDNFFGNGNNLDNILVGAGGNDKLSGAEGNDQLFGGAGRDTLDGGVGNDTLNGGAGADVMYGGRGNDVYIVDNVGDQVIDIASGGVKAGLGFRQRVTDGGHDTVQTTLQSYDLGAFNKGVGVEDLQFTGTGNFRAYGNDLNNAITGGRGNDVLDGSLGNDTLTGGAGKDVFQFSDHAGHDTITDFHHGEDTINLAKVNGMHSFDQLKLTDVDGGVRVDFADASVMVAGQHAASMTAADFSFTDVPADIVALPPHQRAVLTDPIGPIVHLDPSGPIVQQSPLLTHGVSTVDAHVLKVGEMLQSSLKSHAAVDYSHAAVFDDPALHQNSIGADHAAVLVHHTDILANTIDHSSINLMHL